MASSSSDGEVTSGSGTEEPALNPYVVPAHEAQPRWTEVYHPIWTLRNLPRIILGLLITVCSVGTFYLLGLWFPRVACRVWRRKGIARDVLADWSKKRLPKWSVLHRSCSPTVMVRTPTDWIRCDVTRVRLPDQPVLAYQRASGLAGSSASVWRFLFRYSFKGVPFHYHPLHADFIEHSPTMVELPSRPQPISDSEARLLRIRDGKNSLAFPLTPWYGLLIPRLLSPFFVFQILAAIIWFYEGYVTFSILIFVMSLGSVSWEAFTVGQAERGVRAMSGPEGFATVLRPTAPVRSPIPRTGTLFAESSASEAEGRTSRPPTPVALPSYATVRIPTSDLVLGDILLLPPPSSQELPFPVPADLILLQGSATVDESGLTGESAPVVRTAPEWGAGNGIKSATLHAGSRILATQAANYTQFPQLDPEAYAGAADWTSAGTPTISTSRLPGSSTPTTARHPPVLAMVTTPLPASAVGSLHRSLLFPSSPPFKFKRDSMIFLGILCCVAIVGVVKRVVEGIQRGTESEGMWITSLDMITIAIPPALPIVLTIGTGFALTRLRAIYGIGCIDPQRVNFAGRVTLACWDKTGTLTGQGVVGVGVREYKDGTWMTKDTSEIADEVGRDRAATVMATCHSIVVSPVAFSPAHGSRSTTVDLLSSDSDYDEDEQPEPQDGLLGQPLELTMFRLTQCRLVPPDDDGLLPTPMSPTSAAAHPSLIPVATVYPVLDSAAPLQILRRFEFDNTIQLSSAITLVPGSNPPSLLVTIKGSPDSIRAICNPDSLPPEHEWDAEIHRLAGSGMYVLGLATRSLPLDSLHMPRAHIERGAEFAGLLLMRNPVKRTSEATIKALREADVRNVMITGDDVRTGVWVARRVGIVGKGDSEGAGTAEDDAECYILDYHEGVLTVETTRRDEIAVPAALLHSQLLANPTHALAVTSRALEYIVSNPPESDPDMVNWVVQRASVFARIRPTWKSWIVEEHAKRGEIVAMCGDGMNDCGALKAAHIGLALSDAEASIVAPFTSRKKRVRDLVELIREGRCALETSFTAFKFMLLYPIVQLTFAFYLQHIHSNLANNEYFFDDVVLVFGMQLFMLNLGPPKHLSAHRPTDSLFHPQVIVSIIGQVTLFLGFFALVIWQMYEAPWFCSIPEATVGLDGLTFLPLPDADPNELFPCYPIDGTSYHDTRWNWLYTSYENSIAWLFGHTQFWSCAVAFTAISRFRAPIWTDPKYCVYLVLSLTAVLFLLLTPPAAEVVSWFLYQVFGIIPSIPFSFRLFMTGIFVLDAIVSVFLWEYLVVNILVDRWVESWRNRQQRRKTQQEMRDAEVAEERASIAIEDAKRVASAEWARIKGMEMESLVGSAAGRKAGLDRGYFSLGGTGKTRQAPSSTRIPIVPDRIF